MSIINILSPHVADLIAAGEVVEHPASAVKELLENAADAGAKAVTIELRGGGMTYIRVTDDGCGMSPEDAGIAFMRHATSKLRDERGLEAIGTMGFRGEALAAISAVSRIELRTRRKGAGEGTRVTLEAGDIQDMGPCGCPEGTTMIVRDLFYNTPARLEFMKSHRAGAATCILAARRFALGHPDISVRCIRDQNEEFFSSGDGRLDSCVYTLLGRDFASGVLECASEDEAFTLRGYVSRPHACRGNRAMQFFFVNGRPIRSAMLQAALEQAYRNTVMTGRFPGCVLYLEVSPAAVDVNVHPTKAEVKFSEEKRAFDCVYYAVLSALQQETGSAEVKLSRSTEAKKETPAAPKADFFKTMPAAEYKKTYYPAPAKSAPAGVTLHSSTAPYQTRMDLPKSPPIYTPRPAPIAPAAPVRPAVTNEAAPKPVQHIPSTPRAEIAAEPVPVQEIAEPRLVGEAMNTYIIIERGDDLLLIDKHAAHERILFDKFRAEQTPIMSQTLLLPVTFSPDADTLELLTENAELLNELGFELESFGETSLILRAVPADVDAESAEIMLEELCTKLRRSTGFDKASVRDSVLHTVACKAAIKAGRASEPEELMALARRVLSGEIKYCPHGRPVAVTLTKKELDRQFRRI